VRRGGDVADRRDELCRHRIDGSQDGRDGRKVTGDDRAAARHRLEQCQGKAVRLRDGDDDVSQAKEIVQLLVRHVVQDAQLVVHSGRLGPPSETLELIGVGASGTEDEDRAPSIIAEAPQRIHDHVLPVERADRARRHHDPLAIGSDALGERRGGRPR
jgi:hypothetical protein